MRGGAFLNGKEGRVGFRKKSPKYFLEKTFSIRKDYQNPSILHASYPSLKD